MASKYYDTSAVIQVLGCIYNKPSLLDDEKYTFSELDFENNDFHKILFGTMYNLYQLGTKQMSIAAIEDYLEQRPKKAATYKVNKGAEYLLHCKDNAQEQGFNYYYNRLKKMTMLRGYASIMDISFIYDPDNLDVKKKQQQEDWLDNSSFNDIVKAIDDHIDNIKLKYSTSELSDSHHIGEGLDDLLTSLEEHPDYGYPMFGKYMNTITRGARFTKFYLRSAATNVGKTRAMIGDACYISCSQMYDLRTATWITIGKPEGTLFIPTEQSQSEVQLMALAFISGVNEEHIATNTYYEGERERVIKAKQILEQSKLYIEEHPDFNVEEIETAIKQGLREHQIQYFFFDYINTSMKIMEEITRRSGGVRIREDNILYLLSAKLKALAQQYGVFILSSTQLNADYQESETPDQNLLRGAKSIADKIDVGMIMLDLTSKDKEAITPIVSKLNCDFPNVKISVYKNRGNKWKCIYLWVAADKGICRFEPMFVTDWQYNLQDINDLKLKIEEERIEF